MKLALRANVSVLILASALSITAHTVAPGNLGTGVVMGAVNVSTERQDSFKDSHGREFTNWKIKVVCSQYGYLDFKVSNKSDAYSPPGTARTYESTGRLSFLNSTPRNQSIFTVTWAGSPPMFSSHFHTTTPDGREKK